MSGFVSNACVVPRCPWVLVLVLLAFATNATAAVWVELDGPELLVNELVPRGIHDSPSLAAVGSGRVAIVWSGHQQSSSVRAIHHRVLVRGGTNTSESLLNSFALEEFATTPEIASNSGGQGVVVWEDFDGARGSGVPGEPGDGIMARRVGADGPTPGADPFWVNETILYHQRDPEAAVLEDGSFLLLWHDVGHIFYDAEKADILGRLYASDGTARTGEFLIAATDEGYPFGARAADLSGDAYAAVWARYSNMSDFELSDLDVVIRILDANGEGGEPTLVNTQTEQGQWWPDIAVCDNGQILVAWISTGIAGDDGAGIVARWLNGDGTPASEEFHVNEYVSGTQNFPVVAVTPDCSGLVVWQSFEQDGDKDGIFGRVLSPGGGPASSEFRINTTTAGSQGAGHFRTIAIAADSPTSFVVAWPSHPEENDDYPLMSQWFCFVGDGQNTCGNATCVGDTHDAGPDGTNITTVDALAVLRAAVGVRSCPACRCDTDDSGAITARDALRAMQLALGMEVSLSCPACS